MRPGVLHQFFFVFHCGNSKAELCATWHAVQRNWEMGGGMWRRPWARRKSSTDASTPRHAIQALNVKEHESNTTSDGWGNVVLLRGGYGADECDENVTEEWTAGNQPNASCVTFKHIGPSSATVLQTVAYGKTVKADASTVPVTGQGSSSGR